MSSAMTGVGQPWKGLRSLLAVLALSLLLYSRRNARIIGVALLLLALYRFGQCLELVGKS